MRGLRPLLGAFLAMGSVLPAATTLVTGSDEATILVPAGVRVEDYVNDGYRLAVADGVAHVEVRLGELGSRQGFSTAPRPPVGREALLAWNVTAGSKSRYDAASRILAWVAVNVRYDLDREAPQDATSVLDRRSAYCTGIARLTVRLLEDVGIPAREVAGYLAEDLPGGPRSGYHRWVEIFYDDRGWVFADPLASHHFVPATYLRLASDTITGGEPGDGLLMSREARLEDRAVVSPAPLARVRVRPNLGSWRATSATAAGMGMGGSSQ